MTSWQRANAGAPVSYQHALFVGKYVLVALSHFFHLHQQLLLGAPLRLQLLF